MESFGESGSVDDSDGISVISESEEYVELDSDKAQAERVALLFFAAYVRLGPTGLEFARTLVPDIPTGYAALACEAALAAIAASTVAATASKLAPASTESSSNLNTNSAALVGIAAATASTLFDAVLATGDTSTADIASQTSILPDDVVPFAISAIACAPLAEELYFRHLLLRLFDTRVPKPLSNFTTALVFSTAHAVNDTRTLMQLAILGVLFAISYRRLGGWRASFATHAAYNATQLLLVTQLLN